ncbi:hypothetical protein [Longimicrobium sp.]|uniref:hypothetical protein n=1 Tax=Longimicrobium sp. TaxID=2029185 RepID=UPI002B63F722|nr:hypothetical protein [Longimicrobium sp.]HSU16839.1 hypothetical protein [Longimicrobium sp.]
MKKLRLEMDGLQVETFETLDAVAGRIGTVRARSGTEYTRCWGLCGDASDAAFGCGNDTEGCTNDPYNDNCHSYADQCPMTVYPSATCYGTCGAPGGESVCGAYVCTDGCTV